MWHEARRREKATQKLLSDHKRRAEKRREENRIDPSSLLQVHGLKAKLCLEPSVYKQAVRSLVAWQGDKSVTIDRFDVRATLSSIPSESVFGGPNAKDSSSRSQTILDSDESESMKRLLNYERYRLLIQNDLNKVPEESRLKLVATSDSASDAKMRKLRNNKFGTSGETSMSTNLLGAAHNSRLNTRDRGRKGTAIGFNYNAVPPPQTQSYLTDYKGAEGSSQLLSHSGAGQGRDMGMIDLDEYDNFELDSVSISTTNDLKRVHETARKYGLSNEELMLLAKRDGQEIGAGEVLKELIRLNKKNQADLESSNVAQVYGPALPPELASTASSSVRGTGMLSDQSHESSPSSNGSPIRQRSPSGANIPLRNGGNNESERSQSPRADDSILLRVSERKVDPSRVMAPGGINWPLQDKNSRLNLVDLASKRSTTLPLKPMMIHSPSPPSPYSDEDITLGEDVHQVVEDLPRAADPPTICQEDHLRGREEIKQRSPPVARRAATPLIYKKNCRSSRSISRELRLTASHHSPYHYDRSSSYRRRRSRSRSRSRSLTISTSSRTTGFSEERAPRRRRPSGRSRRRRRRRRRR